MSTVEENENTDWKVIFPEWPEKPEGYKRIKIDGKTMRMGAQNEIDSLQDVVESLAPAEKVARLAWAYFTNHDDRTVEQQRFELYRALNAWKAAQ